MAFLLEVDLKGYEFRGDDSGVSKNTGKAWRTLKFEDSHVRQVEVSVPAALQDDYTVLNLKRGGVYDVRVRAVATPKTSYIQLVEPPTLSGEGVDF